MSIHELDQELDEFGNPIVEDNPSDVKEKGILEQIGDAIIPSAEAAYMDKNIENPPIPKKTVDVSKLDPSFVASLAGQAAPVTTAPISVGKPAEIPVTKAAPVVKPEKKLTQKQVEDKKHTAFGLRGDVAPEKKAPPVEEKKEETPAVKEEEKKSEEPKTEAPLSEMDKIWKEYTDLKKSKQDMLERANLSDAIQGFTNIFSTAAQRPEFIRTPNASAAAATYGDKELAALINNYQKLKALQSKGTSPYEQARTDLIRAQIAQMGKLSPADQEYFNLQRQKLALEGKKLDEKGESATTIGKKEMDRSFAKEYTHFLTSRPDQKIKNELDKIDQVEREIEKGDVYAGENLLGKTRAYIAGKIPTSKTSAASRKIESITAGQLKEILGGQFGQIEGIMHLARSFSNADNKQDQLMLLRQLKEQIKTSFNAKKKAMQYFAKNETLEGFDPYQTNTQQESTQSKLGAENKQIIKRGDVVDGYEFLGGDAKDKNNWKKL